MSNLEKVLDPDRFARVHRSWIVNVDRVKVLEPMFRGDYIVVQRDGRRVSMSKAYRQNLEPGT
jgi:two-component system LytT family response regulator